MKLIVLFAGFAFTLMTSAVSAQQSIMVTGDSVSSGFNQTSYRLPLLDSLRARGCTVDMVGDQSLNTVDFRDAQSSPSMNVTPFTPAVGYDTDHQAFASITAAQLLSGMSSTEYTVLPISAYTLAYQPDFVLLHSGTTELNLAIASGTDTVQEIHDWAKQTTDEVESVIDQILASHYQPEKLRILLANFVPHTGLFDSQSQLDAAALASKIYSEKLEYMVAAKADTRVLIVDVATDFDVDTMLAPDKVHPNTVGEQHIAGAFLPILKGAGLCSDNVPMISTPANGSTVTGESVTVDWKDNGLAVDNWRVYVGDDQSGGSATYFDSGVLGSAVRSVVVPDLPQEHANLFIALHYQVDGIWDLSITSFISDSSIANVRLPTLATAKTTVNRIANDATGVRNDGRLMPELLSPTPGKQLPGTDVTFKWTANSVPVKQWYMRVGLKKGTTEFAGLRFTDPDTTRLRVTGLPSDGITPVFVQFSYRQAGNWVIQYFEYRASEDAGSEKQQPTIVVEPAAEQPTVEQPIAEQPIAEQPAVTEIPDIVAVVPTGNIPRLTTPQLFSPIAGTQLPGTNVTFKWRDNGLLPQQWYVRVGLSKGSTEFVDLRITDPTTNQLQVRGLPGDGITPVFVEFSYRQAGRWVVQNLEYLAFGNVNKAGDVNPKPVVPPTPTSTPTSTGNPLALTTPLLKPVDLTFDNSTWSGNPFDLLATGTFIHQGTNTARTGELFYAGDNQWKLRFVADKVGTWRYTTRSADTDLNNHTGTITVTASQEKGFVLAKGDKWIRSATNKAFVPQYVMASSLDKFAADPRKIERDLKSFVDEHGFTGFHIRGYCQWFKLGSDACSGIAAGDRDPDLATFEVVENIIKQTSARGGTTHIWMYGDNARRQNPSSWGLNGTVDRRLQRYLAARLGALPGWTIGYGYDVGEWATPSQIKTWYTYLNNRMMYPHLTSARSNKNVIMQHTDVLSYSSYEQHVPDYERYVSAIKDRPKKPSFSEDRFRVNAGFPAKDYTYVETRRSMWHSAMAGGVANIWGNMQFSRGGSYNNGSRAYPNKDELRIYSDFIGSRFRSNFKNCNSLSDGLCLKTPSHSEYIVYKEDTRSIDIDLRDMAGQSDYTAMDTTTGEISSGTFDAEQQIWMAPYTADWVLEIR